MTAFIDGGRLLVTTADEKVARIWDVATGLPRHTLHHAAEVVASAISPDGRTLLTLDVDGTAHLWVTAAGKERFPLLHGCGARDALFIADGTLAVTWSRANRLAGCEAKVMMWDVATGQPRATARTQAESIGFSDDGKTLYAVERRPPDPKPIWQDAAEVVRVGDVDTGEERFADPFRTREHFHLVALSPNGSRLLTAEGDTVSVWAVGAELLQSTLAAGTSACLAPQIRRQNLGESETQAQQTFAACERKHGRR